MVAQRHGQYLDTMGVERWRLRRTADAPASSDSMGAGRAASGGEEVGQSAPVLEGRCVEAPATPPLQREPPGAGAAPLIRQAPSPVMAADSELVQWPDLDSLGRAVAACTRCKLHASRNRTVFGVGDPQADWMLVGEAPGADEDRLGEPFVGRSGGLLDAMLQALGLRRDQVYITNILKCRPPGNRDPLSDESACCRAFLDHQIDLVSPRLIMAVGRIAAQNLLATTQPMKDLRGRVHRYRSIPLIAGYHPAYLLRSPSEKRKAWEDLKLAQRTLRECG